MMEVNLKFLEVHRFPYFLHKLLGIYVNHYFVRVAGVRIAGRCYFFGMPIIGRVPDSTISLGSGCEFRSRSDMTDLGINHPVVLRTLRPGASIVIGDNTGISGGVICAAIRVEIGKDCLLGANVTISDTDFHPINPDRRRYNNNPQDIAAEPVFIGDNVFIGTGAIVLKGVRIGNNSVVGAGSVVTKDVPPNTIVAGNPAKLIKVMS